MTMPTRVDLLLLIEALVEIIGDIKASGKRLVYLNDIYERLLRWQHALEGTVQ